MISSNVAYSNSLNNQTVAASKKVADEIMRLEIVLNTAIQAGSFMTNYNALIVGNPAVDPQNTDGLTDPQKEFLAVLTDNGYVVTRDPDLGWWHIEWAKVGPEDLVFVYTIRTTLAPGAIQQQTIALIEAYFENHIPSGTSKVTLFNPQGTGGNIDETLFGASASTFYEYLVIANQQDNLDYSTDLKNELVGGGLGYLSGNVMVWRMV